MTVGELISLLRNYESNLPVRVEGSYPDTASDMAIIGVKLVANDKQHFLMIETD